MNIVVKEIVNSALILFSVIDILGSVPIIIDLRQKAGHIQSEKAALAALVIMILFLFVGEWILQMMGIDVSSFAIAGSFIIFLLAVEMILGISLFRDVSPETASIVPLAFPLIAGAGTLTTLLSLKAEYHEENILIGIILNLMLVYLVLKRTNFIERVLGKNGINVLRKIFGIILLAIAVKLFRTNTGI